MHKLLAAFVILSCAGVCAAGPDTAADIIKKADAVRNPDKPFSVVTTLTEYREGKPTSTMDLTVYSLEDGQTGQYQTLAAFNSPAKDKGKVMLKNGNELWFYDPQSKASVRISPQQRLMGQASNGDVMTTSLHVDYTAELAGEESITDMSKAKLDCQRLNLKSAGGNSNYYRIEYWVEKGTCRPVKAKFYSDSDRLLKIVYFGGYKLQLGVPRPTEAIIIDGVDRNLVTKMFFNNYAYKRIPPEWFQKEYLPRFKAE